MPLCIPPSFAHRKMHVGGCTASNSVTCMLYVSTRVNTLISPGLAVRAFMTFSITSRSHVGSRPCLSPNLSVCDRLSGLPFVDQDIRLKDPPKIARSIVVTFRYPSNPNNAGWTILNLPPYVNLMSDGVLSQTYRYMKKNSTAMPLRIGDRYLRCESACEARSKTQLPATPQRETAVVKNRLLFSII